MTLVVALTFAALTLVPGAVSPADATETPSVACPLEASGDQIFINIAGPTTGWMVGAPDLEPNALGPITTTIPTGIYRVAWASYDDHSVTDEGTEAAEIWYLEAGPFSTVTTTDIPDDADLAQGLLGTPFVVASDQTAVTIRHGGPADTVNSVFALCAVLDPLTPNIDIEKSTNGEDADTPTGPYLSVDTTVDWSYTVTNTGELPLTGVLVTDDKVTAVTCPQDALAPGESMTCTATGTAQPGQYVNIGTVTGTDAVGVTVTDSDTSHYFGSVPAIDVIKDVDPVIIPGGATTDVTWTITVANTGNVPLADVLVTDELTPACGLPIGDLATGETTTYTCTSTLTPDAPTWSFTNIAIATGSGPAGTQVTAQDDAVVTPEFVAASGTIGDTVWADDNANGVQDSGEKGIANARVRLTFPDGTVQEATTNSNGLYLFSALAAGTYKAELIVSSIPKPAEGDLMVTTKSSFTIELADGQSYLDADFGVVGTLPKTGLDTGAILGIALALLLAGAAAVLVSGRKEDSGDALA